MLSRLLLVVAFLIVAHHAALDSVPQYLSWVKGVLQPYDLKPTTLADITTDEMTETQATNFKRFVVGTAITIVTFCYLLRRGMSAKRAALTVITRVVPPKDDTPSSSPGKTLARRRAEAAPVLIDLQKQLAKAKSREFELPHAIKRAEQDVSYANRDTSAAKELYDTEKAKLDKAYERLEALNTESHSLHDDIHEIEKEIKEIEEGLKA